jgi:hypothetical protein
MAHALWQGPNHHSNELHHYGSKRRRGLSTSGLCIRKRQRSDSFKPTSPVVKWGPTSHTSSVAPQHATKHYVSPTGARTESVRVSDVCEAAAISNNVHSLCCLSTAPAVFTSNAISIFRYGVDCAPKGAFTCFRNERASGANVDVRRVTVSALLSAIIIVHAKLFEGPFYAGGTRSSEACHGREIVRIVGAVLRRRGAKTSPARRETASRSGSSGLPQTSSQTLCHGFGAAHWFVA